MKSDELRELERQCARGEAEEPLLSAPDGTVGVPIKALRYALDRIDKLEGENEALRKRLASSIQFVGGQPPHACSSGAISGAKP